MSARPSQRIPRNAEQRNAISARANAGGVTASDRGPIPLEVKAAYDNTHQARIAGPAFSLARPSTAKGVLAAALTSPRHG